jgi:uncharacterized protein
MREFRPLVRAILQDYALPLDGTHGVAHWARVFEIGSRLAEETGANAEVVRLFAVFHDSRRTNEGFDDGHGRRGAELAAEMRGRLFTLSSSDFDLRHTACCLHTDGLTDADVTIQTCWDADRLDLGRVLVIPEPNRLCTPAAKRTDLRNWATERAAFQVVPEWLKAEWGIEIR